MRFLSVLLILLFSNAQAEKLIFSNNNEQVDITGDVVIDNQNGNITVTTQGGDYLIVGDNQPVYLGLTADDSEITDGQNIEVSWTVVNADVCTASTSSGTSSSWNGAKSAGNSSDHQDLNVSVTYSQLPTKLKLTCSNDVYSEEKEVQITAQPISNNGNPQINSFTVNSQDTFVTVSSASPTAQFAWSASDVNSCTASASPSLPGWSGTKQTTGSETLTITRDTTVTLSCDSVTPKTVNIDYTEPGNPNCNGSVYPSLAGIKIEQSYATANDGSPFGTSTGATLKETFGTGEFLALSGFSTDEINFNRRISTYPSPTDLPAWYGVTWSISECPGDFTAGAHCSGVLFPYYSIPVTTDPSADPGDYCIIQPSVNYYLNFVHDIAPYDQTPGRCYNVSHSSCAIFTSETTD